MGWDNFSFPAYSLSQEWPVSPCGDKGARGTSSSFGISETLVPGGEGGTFREGSRSGSTYKNLGQLY